MGKCKKAINFDLDTKMLKEHYPGKYYFNAYRDIKRFLKKNNFVWRQGSGYRSTIPLSQTDVFKTVMSLDKQFPWFQCCVKQFDVTDIGKQYSFIGAFGELGDKGINTPMPVKESSEKIEKIALDEQISSAEKAHVEQSKYEEKSQNIENFR